MRDRSPEPLEPPQLRHSCDPATLGFETTARLEPLRDRVGQDDALDALRFGLAVDNPAYNIFAVGKSGSGRTSMIRQQVSDKAADEPTPSDWCYVYNLEHPREPVALQLPAGRGPELSAAIDEFLRELRSSLPQAFRSEEFRARRDQILGDALEEQRRLAEDFKRRVEEDPHVALVQTPTGLLIAPARGNEPIPEEQLRELPSEQQEKIRSRRREMEKEFAGVQQQMTEPQREAQAEIRDLQREVAQRVVRGRISHLEDGWADVPSVVSYLDDIARDVIQNAERLAGEDQGDDEISSALISRIQQDPLAHYRVNVIVTHEPDAGAPVVEEPNPTYHNLIGRMEHRVQFGTMVTDFREISAGSLHRANGGYLILEAADLLRQPFAWMGLKKALQTETIRLEDLREYTSPLATTTLRPEPIPLRAKVILIGDPYTYYLLAAADEDFSQLFKVKADFKPYMDRGAPEERAYGNFIAKISQRESLPDFSAGAVARIIEFGSRLAGHQRRLTTRFESIEDLIREAALQARADNQDVVTGEHVTAGNRARERRVNRPERELLDLLEDDVLAIEPSGEATGQLYGLAVLSSGDHVFARPIKLEASAFMGTSGVVDIEREVRLGGPLHNKGVLVLSGYLGDLFAQRHPLILSATLSFDQLYDEVEGDSASAAELFALVSSIAEVPIRQGIAITGALNQKGDIQPIGGVTTKIEGFFRACQRKGLSGGQGVIIPARNLDNLCLDDEVVDAVREGRFSIWPIYRVEQGWEILTGIEAGIRGPDGRFPDKSVYGRAAARLATWARLWREFGSPIREGRRPEGPASTGGHERRRSTEG